jgi:hypothetical protein
MKVDELVLHQKKEPLSHINKAQEAINSLAVNQELF